MKIALSILILLFSISTNVSLADNSLFVYRGSDGKMTVQSRQNLRILVSEAKEMGSVNVWVDFGIHFEPDPNLRTTVIAAAEQAQKQEYINEHIKPIIELGNAIEVEVTPSPLAPGIMLQVNHKGLTALAMNRYIKYIGQLIVTS